MRTVKMYKVAWAEEEFGYIKGIEYYAAKDRRGAIKQCKEEHGQNIFIDSCWQEGYGATYDLIAQNID